MLGIKADTLRTELSQILEKVDELKKTADDGVPGDDMPSNDVHEEIFQVQMRGELLLAAQRLLALAECLKDD